MFYPWPEIEAFHNVRKFIKVDPGEWWRTMSVMHGTNTVQYRAKVKLHGTNAAIQIHSDGKVVAQSRTAELSVGNDNAGFAAWVRANEENWRSPGVYEETNTSHIRDGMVIYGEWSGPGIQKGVAISSIPKRVFVVFAARPMNANRNQDHTTFAIDPLVLEAMVHGIPDTYVLPWYDGIDIDWAGGDEEMVRVTTKINSWVKSVEEEDPWVASTFGVKGTGEGLVFYPVSNPHLGWDTYQNLVFKAKGEAHKNIKTAAPAQINAEAAASIDAFADMVLTTARLEQGATAVNPSGMLLFDQKLTGKFVNWIENDVKKETPDELEASGLEWKQVQKPVATKARTWYLNKCKE